VTRAGDAAFPEDEVAPEIRLGAWLHNHFNSERHLVDRQTFKLRRSAALAEWQSLVG